MGIPEAGCVVPHGDPARPHIHSLYRWRPCKTPHSLVVQVETLQDPTFTCRTGLALFQAHSGDATLALRPRSTCSASTQVAVNWTYTLFFIMSELWGSVVISLLFWGLVRGAGWPAGCRRAPTSAECGALRPLRSGGRKCGTMHSSCACKGALRGPIWKVLQARQRAAPTAQRRIEGWRGERAPPGRWAARGRLVRTGK